MKSFPTKDDSNWTRVIVERVEAGLAPGVVGLVDRGGQTGVYAAGWRDLASRQAMAANCIFRIASVSKPITAVAAMILVDDGLVTLDGPLDAWLPELADRRVLRRGSSALIDTVAADGPVTLRGLLAMTFGLGIDFGGTSAVAVQMRGMRVGPFGFPGDADEYMRRIGVLPLQAQPGVRWLYHMGIDVAGVLVERVAGLRLGAFLRARIFEPLGMVDSTFVLKPDQLDRLATLYVDLGGGCFSIVPDGAPRTHPRPMEQGGSELLSTATDLGRFGRMLLDGGRYGELRILSKELIAEMRRDQISVSTKAASPVFPGFWESHGWGLGVTVVTAANDVFDVPGAFGWWGGTGTALFMDPSTDTVMVTLSQRLITDIADSANADAIMKAALSG